jgi:hypothetical protein
VGDDLAPGPDPLADLVRVATSAVIRSTGRAGLVKEMPSELMTSELCKRDARGNGGRRSPELPAAIETL